jgi:4-amino-4-deoxy-L-arabinose transferase-like glycosyltransferase
LENPRAIYVLVALFVALGFLYSFTTPLFEAGDELWHYPHVQWLARGNGLPVQDPTQKQLWEQEGGQPPLYYLTNAALTFWIDTSDLEERLWRNPYAKIGVPLAFGNKNMIAHTNAEDFPWHNTALAVHLIRLLSVLFSAGTVFLTYKLAREITETLPRNVSETFQRNVSTGLAFFAACIVAFNPMFLFISASVNNDSLAALLATSAMFLIVQLVTRGATDARLLAMGVICGLALLTKVSNLAVLGVAGVVILWLAWRTRDWKILLRGGVWIGVPVTLLAGWWFARNFVLYGDPLAFNVWLQIAGGRAPQTLLGLLDEFQGFRISFWGNFGGVNVIAPEWVYTILDAFLVLGVVGLLWGAVRRALPALLWIPALQVAIVFAALIRWTLLTYASQGRLMFPAIAAIGILLTFGLSEFSFRVLRIANLKSKIKNQKSEIILPALLSLFLFLFALAAPFFLIAPVYAQPARWANDANVPNPVHIFFDAGDAQPELVGYDTPRFLQGNELPLTLYWRTAKPIASDLAMYVHVYDTQGNLLGQWDAFPGNGLAPTRLWQPNEILVDYYRVPVTNPQTYPPVGRVQVGLSRQGTTRPLTARDPAGNEITPTLTRFKFSQTAPAQGDARATFGDQFDWLDARLRVQRDGQEIVLDESNASSFSLRAGDVLNLNVNLRARGIPDSDYVLFAHLADAQGNIVAQRDAQPLNDLYPTHLWNANETVSDTLSIPLPQSLPQGNYTLEFGIYRANDLTRLPIQGAAWDIWQAQSDRLVAPLLRAP